MPTSKPSSPTLNQIETLRTNDCLSIRSISTDRVSESVPRGHSLLGTLCAHWDSHGPLLVPSDRASGRLDSNIDAGCSSGSKGIVS
jgi:hypothetical protein